MHKKLWACATYDEYYVCAMFLAGFVLCDPTCYEASRMYYLLIHAVLVLGMLGIRYVMRLQAHLRDTKLLSLKAKPQVFGWTLVCVGSYGIHYVCDRFWILASFLLCLCLVLCVYQWILHESRCA